MCLETIVVTECGFLGVAEGGSNTIAGHVGNGGLGVGNYGPALDVEAFDFGKRAADDCWEIKICVKGLKD